MIMEDVSEWFDRLKREQQEQMRKEFEEYALPKNLKR